MKRGLTASHSSSQGTGYWLHCLQPLHGCILRHNPHKICENKFPYCRISYWKLWVLNIFDNRRLKYVLLLVETWLRFGLFSVLCFPCYGLGENKTYSRLAMTYDCISNLWKSPRPFISCHSGLSLKEKLSTTNHKSSQTLILTLIPTKTPIFF